MELVAFSSYEAVERTLHLGETSAWSGGATWKQVDRASVEVFVGEKALRKRRTYSS
jgi:hypothetical protein